jgi:hypothetical protein
MTIRKWLAKRALLGICVLGLGAPALAQQTGAIIGTVSSGDAGNLPGVTVEASANVLPQSRQTVTDANGQYRLPLLPPGEYTLSYSLDGMATEKRSVQVLLQQTATVDVSLSVDAVSEEIQVVAQSTLVDRTSSELKAAIAADVIEALPVGQQYRDLVKLIPGVQYTNDAFRGPSAGGSGQDNVYNFDGVNVNVPLFGTLSAEPSSHDVSEVSVVKGGAKAVDFNRSAGFSINTISKSGTNAFKGALSYQVQNHSMTSDRRTTSATQFDEDKDWAVANIGGPILADRLFFYASYFRPTIDRANRANLYGAVPDLASDRDELFGKLSFSPSDNLLLHGSYRTSDRTERGFSVANEASAGSTSMGNEATLDIGILEGSWIANSRSYATLKFTDFANETTGVPDNLFGFTPTLDGSVDLNIGALDTQGLLVVPVPLAGQTAFNNFIAPYINRYGYLQNGVRVGGGRVGGGADISFNDFYRQSYQLGYDFQLGSSVTHNIHVGYQWMLDEEDLLRDSNGWGTLTIPGGRINCPANSTCAGQRVFFQAQVQQQGVLNVPVIHSEYESQNVEINDEIRFGSVTVNLGVLLSNDELYGQGLRENDNNVSGFELDKNSQYKMYETDWGENLQPRLGVVWAYNESNTVYLNLARYVPAASSLPRAASWARNSAALINAYFDQNGNFIGSSPESASSGKFFADDLDPRTTDEVLIGTSRELGGGWSARLHGRYRYSYNFWEDTNNDARLLFRPPAGVPAELYVPNLATVRGEIGGSTYVIAELDGAFTKYYEAGVETEWRGRNAYFRGSYVWSHYYGNFDQDNTTTALANDGNIFIGSSNIADGAGRQLWDFKYGDLRGDRRHQLKAYGYYTLPWRASVGAYAIYQSGQPWERQDVEVYRALTTSLSDTNRYAEPAGSRKTDDHYQLDLNYSHDFPIGDRFNIQARVDIYNVFDKQTGYNVQSLANSANFGREQSFYDPRRFQVAIKLEF